jgi:hypothetical protein
VLEISFVRKSEVSDRRLDPLIVHGAAQTDAGTHQARQNSRGFTNNQRESHHPRG